MSQKIYVTSAEVEAARAIVERNAARGKATTDPIRKIANAKPIEVSKQGEGRFTSLRSPARVSVAASAKATKVIGRTSAISPKVKKKLADDLIKKYNRSKGRTVSRSSTTTGRYVSNLMRKAKTK